MMVSRAVTPDSGWRGDTDKMFAWIYDLLELISPDQYIIADENYEAGMVKQIQWVKPCLTALVQDAQDGLCQVRIETDESDQVHYWHCSCSDTSGKGCWHLAAVLIALDNGEWPVEDHRAIRDKCAGENFSEKSDMDTCIKSNTNEDENSHAVSDTDASSESKESEILSPLEELLWASDKEDLIFLILEHCEKDQDKAFQSKVERKLQAQSMGSEPVEAMVMASLRQNAVNGNSNQVDMDGVKRDMNAILRQLQRMEHREKLTLMAVATLFMSEIGLFSNVIRNDSAFSRLVASTMTLLEQSVERLAREGSETEKRLQLTSLLTCVRSVMPRECYRELYQYLQSLTRLTDSQSEKFFYDVLDYVLSQTVVAAPAVQHMVRENDALTRYQIALAVHGIDMARIYANLHLELSNMRRIAIEADIAHKDYDRASRLCIEAAEQVRRKVPWPSDWDYLLYDIYEQWGWWEKLAEQAKQIYLSGDTAYYAPCRAACRKADIWEERKADFWMEIRDNMLYLDYMDVLAYEGETALLMEQLHRYPDTLPCYSDALPASYNKELEMLCKTQIQAQIQEMTHKTLKYGTSDVYTSLRNQWEMLYRRSGADVTRAFLDELEPQFPGQNGVFQRIRHDLNLPER